jgi:hypothetical protein
MLPVHRILIVVTFLMLFFPHTFNDAQASQLESDYPHLVFDQCPPGEQILYFQPGSGDRILGTGDRILTLIADAVSKKGGYVLISGHRSRTEDESAKPPLDVQRAEFIRNALVSKGISLKQIWTRAEGPTERPGMTATPATVNFLATATVWVPQITQICQKQLTDLRVKTIRKYCIATPDPDVACTRIYDDFVKTLN